MLWLPFLGCNTAPKETPLERFVEINSALDSTNKAFQQKLDSSYQLMERAMHKGVDRAYFRAGSLADDATIEQLSLLRPATQSLQGNISRVKLAIGQSSPPYTASIQGAIRELKGNIITFNELTAWFKAPIQPIVVKDTEDGTWEEVHLLNVPEPAGRTFLTKLSADIASVEVSILEVVLAKEENSTQP